MRKPSFLRHSEIFTFMQRSDHIFQSSFDSSDISLMPSALASECISVFLLGGMLWSSFSLRLLVFHWAAVKKKKKNSGSMSWTKIEGEGRRRGSKLKCVCVCVCVCVCWCVCSLQLWNVESARRAQWYVWNQSEKEGSGTWRVKKKSEKRKTRPRRKKGEKRGEREEELAMLEERKAGKEDSEGCSGLSQAYPGLCWWFTVQVCLHEQSMWSDWGDDVEVRQPSVCVCVCLCVCVLPMRSCLWCRLALVPVKITWSTCSTFIEFLCHFYMKWIKSMFSKLLLLVILFILLTC